MTLTLSGSGTIGGLVAGGLPDATVTAADLASGAARTNFGAGAVLQVVSISQIGWGFNTSSTSLVNIGLNASITPSSSSSKILVIPTICYQANSNGSYSGLGIGLTRGGSLIYYTQAHINPNTNNFMSTSSFNYLDSPNTSSACTYSIQVDLNWGGSFYVREGAKSTITLMEIAG